MKAFIFILILKISDILSAPENKQWNPQEYLEMEDIMEINSNNEEMSFFQGDMVLTAQQWSDMHKRNFVLDTKKFWTAEKYSIPWYDETGSSKARSAILSGIRHIEQHTCLRFKELTSPGNSLYFMNFISSGGCWSYYGRVHTYGQNISIGRGCESRGIVVHEIMHALGSYHEQSRQDSVNYVTVIPENLRSGYLSNFNIYSSNYYGTMYDAYSIMHYGTKFFSSNGLPTLRARYDPKLELFMGNADHMTFYDKKQINTAYGCIADWEAACPSVTCQNEGYVGPNCACVCRDGTTGANCETENANYYDAIIQAESPALVHEVIIADTVISSPGYPSTSSYPTIKYTYIIEKNPCKVTVLNITTLSMFPTRDGKCVSDYLEIRHLESETVGKVYCGSDNPGVYMTTDTLVLYGQDRSPYRQWNGTVSYVSMINQDWQQDNFDFK